MRTTGSCPPARERGPLGGPKEAGQHGNAFKRKTQTSTQRRPGPRGPAFPVSQVASCRQACRQPVWSERPSTPNEQWHSLARGCPTCEGSGEKQAPQTRTADSRLRRRREIQSNGGARHSIHEHPQIRRMSAGRAERGRVRVRACVCTCVLPSPRHTALLSQPPRRPRLGNSLCSLPLSTACSSLTTASEENGLFFLTTQTSRN